MPAGRDRGQHASRSTSALRRHRVLRLPLVRGVVALGESLAIGFKALGISANAQLGAGEEAASEISGGAWARRSCSSSLALAVGLFFVVPGRARPA